MPNLARSVSISFIAKDGMSGSLHRMGRNLLYFQKGLGSIMAVTGVLVAGGALIALGNQVAKFGEDSVKAAADFETAFTGVLKTTNNLVNNATGELTNLGETVKQELRDMAKEMPATVEELSKMAEVGGQLGIADKAITSFTEVVAKMAVSTNLTAEDAATSLARMASIFNVSTNDMGEYMESAGAAVVALGNNFATTEKEILQSAMRLSGTGKALGITEADVLGISTALASLGIQSRLGTTAVQKALLQMDEAASSTADGFIDNSKAIKSTTNELTKYANNLSSVEGAAGMTLEQMQSLRDSYIDGGGTIDEFIGTLDSSKVSLLESATNIEALQEQLGRLEARHGKGVDLGVLHEFARVSGMTIEEFKKTWASSGGPTKVFEAFVRGLQDPANNAQEILAKVGFNNQQQVRTFLSLAGAGDKLSSAIAMSNKEWKAQNALNTEANRRYSTFASQVQMMRNRFNDLKITIGDLLLPSLLDVSKALSPLIDSMGDKLVPIVKSSVIPVIERFAKVLEGIGSGNYTDLFSGIKMPEGGILSGLNDINSAFSDLVGSLIDAGLIDMLKEIGTGLWDLFKNVIGTTLKSVADILSMLADKVKAHKAEISAFFDLLGTVGGAVIDVFQAAFDIVIPTIDGIIEVFVSLLEMMSNLSPDSIKKFFDDFGKIAHDTFDDIGNGLGDTFNVSESIPSMNKLQIKISAMQSIIEEVDREMLTLQADMSTAGRKRLSELKKQKTKLEDQLSVLVEINTRSAIQNNIVSGGWSYYNDITTELEKQYDLAFGLSDQMSQAATYAGVLSGHIEPGGQDYVAPKITSNDDDTTSYANDLASKLKSAISSALQPTLDEVWKSPDDETRIDEWARRLATLTTDGLNSEWIPALEGQFGSEDWWQPISDAISSGDTSALNGLVTNMLTDNVTDLWDKDVIKQKVRDALRQDQLREALIAEVAAELNAEGTNVTVGDVGDAMGVSPTATTIADSVSSGLPVAMKEAGIGGTMVDAVIDDLSNQEKRMELLATTFANNFAEALPDAMAVSGEAFITGVAHSVAIKLGLEYQE